MWAVFMSNLVLQEKEVLEELYVLHCGRSHFDDMSKTLSPFQFQLHGKPTPPSDYKLLLKPLFHKIFYWYV